jgi:hypothetical protein
MSGACLLITGALLRLLVFPTGSFYSVLGGSVIAACSQAFIQNPVAKMATTWFGDTEVINSDVFDIFREGLLLRLEAWPCPLDVLLASYYPISFSTARKQTMINTSSICIS